MIHLPQQYPHGLWESQAGILAAIFMRKRAPIACFVEVTVRLWINFLAGDMAKAKRCGHDTQKNTRSGSYQTN